MYSDKQYSFSVAYPVSFTLELEGSSPRPGNPMNYRVVDTKFRNDYPPGQVEFRISDNDAADLSSWVLKHQGSYTSALTDPVYWEQTSNQSAVKAVGRDALSFDWTGTGIAVPIHATVFALSPSYLFLLEWWATDPAYAPAIQLVAQQMLDSFRG